MADKQSLFSLQKILTTLLLICCSLYPYRSTPLQRILIFPLRMRHPVIRPLMRLTLQTLSEIEFGVMSQLEIFPAGLS